MKRIEEKMKDEGREIFACKVIDLGVGYDPADCIEVKVLTRDVAGYQVWLSYEDNPIHLVRILLQSL